MDASHLTSDAAEQLAGTLEQLAKLIRVRHPEVHLEHLDVGLELNGPTRVSVAATWPPTLPVPVSVPGSLLGAWHPEPLPLVCDGGPAPARTTIGVAERGATEDDDPPAIASQLP